MPTSQTWILVSNSTSARLFEANSNHELKEIDSMSHPQGRLRNQDLVSDKPGRTFESAANSRTRSGNEPRVEPKTTEFIHFAQSLTEFLAKAHQEGKFKKLYISANPSFLGILRQHITPQVATAIAAEFNADLTHMTPSDIRKHLPYIL